MIAVGASDEVDRRAAFSQTGKHIHLVAPGVNILSTVPRAAPSPAFSAPYEAWSGTSMAAPFVTATVALMLAKSPTATVDQNRAALARGCDLVAGRVAFDQEYGHGRLNVRESLAAIRVARIQPKPNRTASPRSSGS